MTSIANVYEIGMEWRPIVSGLNHRWLPMFLDLKPGLASAGNAGVLPDYALFQNLTSAQLVANNVHYLYMVHPETPAAVPLLRDEASHRDGFEIRFHATEIQATPSLAFDLYLYRTELV